MLRWLQRLLMGKHYRQELQRLERYRINLNYYNRWFGEMPDICEVLRNLRAECDRGDGRYESAIHEGEKVYLKGMPTLRDEVRIARRGWNIKS